MPLLLDFEPVKVEDTGRYRRRIQRGVRFVLPFCCRDGGSNPPVLFR